MRFSFNRADVAGRRAVDIAILRVGHAALVGSRTTSVRPRVDRSAAGVGWEAAGRAGERAEVGT
ncbi:MAG TPA: hypothetical protein VNK89_02530 [Thermoflexus sp.]|nr:hypothetical protein [Thermoflexus sp.]